MASPPFEIYFTGRDDPRDCIIIGEDTKPVFFEFDTQYSSPSTVRTTVSIVRVFPNKAFAFTFASADLRLRYLATEAPLQFSTGGQTGRPLVLRLSVSVKFQWHS